MDRLSGKRKHKEVAPNLLNYMAMVKKRIEFLDMKIAVLEGILVNYKDEMEEMREGPARISIKKVVAMLQNIMKLRYQMEKDHLTEESFHLEKMKSFVQRCNAITDAMNMTLKELKRLSRKVKTNTVTKVKIDAEIEATKRKVKQMNKECRKINAGFEEFALVSRTPKRRKASSSEESEASFKETKPKVHKWDSSDSESEKSMSSSAESESSQESEDQWEVNKSCEGNRIKLNINKKAISSEDDDESTFRESTPSNWESEIDSDESEEEESSSEDDKQDSRPSYQPNYAPPEQVPPFISNPYVATPVPQPNGGFMIDTLLRARNPENEGDELTGVTDIVSYNTQE